jgi:uncharacterized damage-inducible protein DinB
MSSNTPSTKEIIFWDVDRELAVTRKVLEHLPEEHYNWKPHEKSMSLGKLALHVAAMPDWCRGAIAGDSLDAATAPRPPAELRSRKELLEYFDRNAAAFKEAVGRFDPEQYGKTWEMRNGATVMTAQPRPTVYRIWCLNHLIHHRGQLCVYLRLLNVPVPTVYFNTADDPTWVFS